MSQEILAENSDTPPLHVPTTNLQFIEIFIGTMLAPMQTFKHIAATCRADASLLPAAFGIVILVFALDALRLCPANHLGWALFNIPAEVSGGLTLWLLLAGVLGLTALCFGATGNKVRAAFCTIAWSFLPWIFMGPIACFAGLLGNFHILLMIIPFFWILFLQIIAIKESFEMAVWKALLLVLVVPSLLMEFQIMQFIQALSTTFGSLF